MSRTIRITPTARLHVEVDKNVLPTLEDEVARDCDAAFGESSAAGLLWLASQPPERQLPATLVFWRGLALVYFQAACQLGTDLAAQWPGLEPPADELLNVMVSEAPPMSGLEYVATGSLRQLWSELHTLAWQRAQADPNGPQSYLETAHPIWHLLGRVTFHLAENKRDTARPFAFLATYTHRVSKSAKPQHLPLGEALKQYAGAKNQSQLAALLEPVQRAARESALARELLDSRALFQPRAWTIQQAHRFLREIPQLETAGVVVRVPNWWNPRRPRRAQAQVQLGKGPASVAGSDNLLDFEVNVAIDGEPLTDDERRELLSAEDGLMLLRGKWVEVDRERLQQALDHWEQLQQLHPDGIELVAGMRLLAGSNLAGGATDSDETETADWSRIVAGDWLAETLASMRDPQGITGVEPGSGLRATLRPYQKHGVRWLWFMTQLGLGGCLADDMGLGKTIQVIDLFLQRQQQRRAAASNKTAQATAARKRNTVDNENTSRANLLVVPASLIGNWRQELERFAPQLTVFFAHGSETSNEELARVSEQPVKRLADFDVVITTYGTVRRAAWLSQVPWQLVVLDEAQAIKNANSAQTKAIKKLPSSGRLALTGTPIENHVGDLWSIFDFCCPGLLGSASQFKTFVKQLNQRQDAAAFGALRKLVRPYILRRLKTDPNIVPDLPDKTEMRTECGLAKRQAVAYERTVKDLAKRLEVADGIGRRGLVLAVLMQLKQICNHPSLAAGRDSFSANESGKFTRLQSLCEPIAERQERVLVFTQFQSMCQPLADFLAEVFGRTGLVLTGKTPVRKRTDLVRRFQADDGPPFFVISVKAGGSGLNLTAASHVVHFDRWWNPAVENQATDRAFRIGQRRNVLVHKFVCRGTVEERIDQMLQDKQQVADKLLDQGAESMLTEMSDDQLMQFVAIDLDRALTGG